ncbi:MAG: SO_0444 family Cu/Zn efflux transporter [Planctomycetota bacterium]|jgi:uncharacterized membrane protein YraQ (UPF0718 family)
MGEFVRSILIDFWATVAEMSPYLLFGFLVAGILSVFVSQSVVERHLGGKGIWPLVKASLFGVPLPLCSCGVIPVSMSLHKHGASKASAISFLLSTPQTGADSIFVTLSLLGPLFAIFRPLAAFITGIIGGVLVDVFDKDQESEKHESHECMAECCYKNPDKKIVRVLKYGFVTLPRDIGKAMAVGLIIAAFISALIPEGYFAEHLGTGILAMVIMMFLGIPVYVCATASVPIAAALILKGLTPGAAIVFLMTGPATNAASFVTIWKTLGSRTAITYILTVAGCALLSGILLDHIAAGVDFEVVIAQGAMLPPAIKYASAVILIVILAAGAISKKKE